MGEDLSKLAHKDYLIIPTPMKVRNLKKWNTHYQILECKSGIIFNLPYGPICDSKEEAIKYSFRDGINVIDNHPEKLINDNTRGING